VPAAQTQPDLQTNLVAAAVILELPASLLLTALACCVLTTHMGYCRHTWLLYTRPQPITKSLTNPDSARPIS
jgi:hypothetical protein